MVSTNIAQQFIVSRSIARQLLADQCGCSPGEISFGIAVQGKPYLEYPQTSLAFNLSHSGWFCALATGCVASIGVDIEAIRPKAMDVADTVFTRREAAHFAVMQPVEQQRAFFRAWVAKEAYLKATGEGLAGGLNSLELHLGAGPDVRPIAIKGSATALNQWQFSGFDVNDDIVGTVAMETDGAAVNIEIRHISSEC